MRYMQQTQNQFTNAAGVTQTLYEELPPPVNALQSKKVKCYADTDIDEIASRPDVWGENAEMDSYKIWEENLKEIWLAGFDLSILDTLRIPQ